MGPARAVSGSVCGSALGLGGGPAAAASPGLPLPPPRPFPPPGMATGLPGRGQHPPQPRAAAGGCARGPFLPGRPWRAATPSRPCTLSSCSTGRLCPPTPPSPAPRAASPARCAAPAWPRPRARWPSAPSRPPAPRRRPRRQPRPRRAWPTSGPRRSLRLAPPKAACGARCRAP